MLIITVKEFVIVYAVAACMSHAATGVPLLVAGWALQLVWSVPGHVHDARGGLHRKGVIWLRKAAFLFDVHAGHSEGGCLPCQAMMQSLLQVA